MVIICSWCRQEGKSEVVGEKVPLDDPRETHGICVSHRQLVQKRWQDIVRVAGSTHRHVSRTKTILSTLQHWGSYFSLIQNVRL
ncbi:MAG TPA: hypothetical protein VH681_07085 [Nitrospiraceae bacterium]|jgi:hypothetical protein